MKLRPAWLLLGLALNAGVQLTVVTVLAPLELGAWALAIAFPFGFAMMWLFSRRALSTSAGDA